MFLPSLSQLFTLVIPGAATSWGHLLHKWLAPAATTQNAPTKAPGRAVRRLSVSHTPEYSSAVSSSSNFNMTALQASKLPESAFRLRVTLDFFSPSKNLENCLLATLMIL